MKKFKEFINEEYKERAYPYKEKKLYQSSNLPDFIDGDYNYICQLDEVDVKVTDISEKDFKNKLAESLNKAKQTFDAEILPKLQKIMNLKFEEENKNITDVEIPKEIERVEKEILKVYTDKYKVPEEIEKHFKRSKHHSRALKAAHEKFYDENGNLKNKFAEERGRFSTDKSPSTAYKIHKVGSYKAEELNGINSVRNESCYFPIEQDDLQYVYEKIEKSEYKDQIVGWEILIPYNKQAPIGYTTSELDFYKSLDWPGRNGLFILWKFADDSSRENRDKISKRHDAALIDYYSGKGNAGD